LFSNSLLETIEGICNDLKTNSNYCKEGSINNVCILKRSEDTISHIFRSNIVFSGKLGKDVFRIVRNYLIIWITKHEIELIVECENWQKNYRTFKWFGIEWSSNYSHSSFLLQWLSEICDSQIRERFFWLFFFS
jgi:hypothetical protein